MVPKKEVHSSVEMKSDDCHAEVEFPHHDLTEVDDIELYSLEGGDHADHEHEMPMTCSGCHNNDRQRPPSCSAGPDTFDHLNTMHGEESFHYFGRASSYEESFSLPGKLSEIQTSFPSIDTSASTIQCHVPTSSSLEQETSPGSALFVGDIVSDLLDDEEDPIVSSKTQLYNEGVLDIESQACPLQLTHIARLTMEQATQTGSSLEELSSSSREDELGDSPVAGETCNAETQDNQTNSLSDEKGQGGNQPTIHSSRESSQALTIKKRSNVQPCEPSFFDLQPIGKKSILWEIPSPRDIVENSSARRNQQSAFEVVTQPLQRYNRSFQMMEHKSSETKDYSAMRKPLSPEELSYLDAKMDFSENMGMDGDNDDDLEFWDSRSKLSSEEDADRAMAWTGRIPGDDHDDSSQSKRTSALERLEDRLKVVMITIHTVTSHWPQLVALMYWDREPSMYATPLVFGMITMRWIGHRLARRHMMLTSLVASIGFALWALSDTLHESLVFVGLLLASAHEPVLKSPAQTWLRQALIIVSYLCGGILYEAGGRVALGGVGAALLLVQIGVAFVVDRSENQRMMMANASTSPMSMVISEALPIVLEEEETTNFASQLRSCSVSAMHGLITTTTPWLVTLKYQWTNAMVLGALFAGAAALAPMGRTLVPPRFAIYAMTYASLATGLPYRWSFVAGFMLLPSCMKAVPTSPLLELSPFIAYMLAASSAPSFFVVMPHAPSVVACCIAFLVSIVDFVTRSKHTAGNDNEIPPKSDLLTLQKTLF